MTAPLPLDLAAGNRQALRLRSLGMTYSQIAIVMREYHGLGRPESSWRYACRVQGAPPVTRGYAYQQGSPL